jgi:IclR family acetate operon transcriptional repressor
MRMAVSNSSARFLFDILELLGRTDVPLGLTDVRRLLNLPVATAHRGLATLEQTGFAERYQASTRYVLGPMAKRLRQSVISRFAVRDRALPYLRRLSVTTGETTSLSIRIGWYMVGLVTVLGPGDMMKKGVVGQVSRLDVGLAGRVILALLSEAERARLGAYYNQTGVPLSGSWCVDRAALLERGYATEPTAANPNGIVIAMPLYDADRHPTAIVSVEILDAEVWRSQKGVDSLDLDAALKDVAKSLGPVENHYAHLDPDTIRLDEKR